MNNYSVIFEDGTEVSIAFDITKEDGCIRPYGITAVNMGDRTDFARVDKIFFTYAEAEKCIGELIRYQVTPCTLCDIMEDWI